ncbi:nuclear distribution protein nudE-like 1-A [Strongylocentrotus purpuratus]|uniref:NUDE domain-containing protein n=1 Tax=Strongylocentrotus purpuratus TaxID=7668 RepID=A0A7M7P7T6_STRPU|nr:nuclear distribution protein nudE-like 1-A [Strongylocentrotus purpuratus]
MDDEDIPKFSSQTEELEYWKNKAQELKTSLSETKEELEEYQISSQELEAELETQLEQSESKVKDLASTKERLSTECDNLKEKLEMSQDNYLRQINELQDELAQIKAIREELQKYIRELEQTNDDLERAKRTTVTSLEDFEHRLNSAIERNAFLENELDEKESLVVTVQRLKDEARDMRSEINVRVVPDNDAEHAANGRHTPSGDHTVDNKVLHEAETNTTPGKDLQANSTGVAGSGNAPLTPSARVSALNIVGDLLRKVGALENKLASCRNFVKDKEVPRKPGSPVDTPRQTKRTPRSTNSTPSSNLPGVVKITV